MFLASTRGGGRGGEGGGDGDRDEDESDEEGDLEPTDSAAFDLTALTSSAVGSLSTGDGDLDLCKGEGDLSMVDSIRIGENRFTALGGLFSIVLCIGEGLLRNLLLMSIGDKDLDLLVSLS